MIAAVGDQVQQHLAALHPARLAIDKAEVHRLCQCGVIQ
jgi:hypothetical protein